MEAPNGDHEIGSWARTKRLSPSAAVLAAVLGACTAIPVPGPDPGARDEAPDETGTASLPPWPGADAEPPEEDSPPPPPQRLKGTGTLGPKRLDVAADEKTTGRSATSPERSPAEDHPADEAPPPGNRPQDGEPEADPEPAGGRETRTAPEPQGALEPTATPKPEDAPKPESPEPTATAKPEAVPEPESVGKPEIAPESAADAAPGSPTTPTTDPAESEPAASEEYRIGAGDVLEVLVWKNEPLSRTVPVTPRGTVSLPLLGEVEAAGRTPAELRQDITDRLAGFIQDPVVSVLVAEVRSFQVSVIGEARQPGRFELDGVITVLEALALAGGLTEFASRGGISVLRHEKGETRRMPFDYGRAIAGDAAANFPLRPGDIVVVP